jgi:nicotinate-nucleotide adenylyltransferase
MRQKIAMLGGSFNPPHLGHLVLADETVRRLGYDTVVFVPTRVHPWKDMAPGADDGARLEMLRLAAAGNSAFVVEPCELSRGGPSYTHDTVVFLEQKYGAGKIGLILGDDLAADFDKWYRYRELAERTEIILARRVEGSAADFPWPHRELDNALLPVSSSDIRRRIAGARGWRYLVDPAVHRYIIERKLYGTK